ncbi:MAG: LptF/LptG family permease [Rikenellaceae bacterium]
MKLGKFKVGILDRYIIGKFIGTYLFTIAMLIIVIIVFDAVEKIDDFMELNAPLDEILFTYYLNFVPYFINQFSSLITFIVVIFFTSKMAYDTEIVAMLSGGVSFSRLMYPYFLSSLVICGLSLALNLFVIPHSNTIRIEFESQYLKKGTKGNYVDHIYRQIDDSTFIYLKGFNSKLRNAEYMVLESYQDDIITKSITARSANFDKNTRKWKSTRYISRTMQPNGDYYIEKCDKLDTLINLSDDELAKIEDHVQTLNIKDLNSFVDEQQRKGSNMVTLILVDKYNRFAYPVSTFILTLIGVSLSSRKVRGGTGLHIGTGLGLCFSYILFMRFANEFAKGGVIPAVIAVWVPNVVYAIIGIELYRRAPK